MSTLEVHPRPHKHIVTDAETLEQLKKAFPPRPADRILGFPSASIGILSDIPIYIDSCAWGCGDE